MNLPLNNRILLVDDNPAIHEDFRKILLGSSRHGPPIIAFPEWVWAGLIIYLGLLWSLTIYLEQLFMAQIYLWHLTWERAVREALDQNKEMPELVDTPCPEMFARSPGLFAV